MTDVSTEAWRDEWRDRFGLTTDCLPNWTAENWCSWLADGLEIWFSNLPRKDREYAFAPLGIDVGWDQANDAVAKYLTRVCELERSADGHLRLRGRIERGALACFQNDVIVNTPARASFLLRVFHRFRARSLPRMARLSLQLVTDFLRRPLTDEGEDYLSTLCHIVLKNEVIAGDKQFEFYIEQVLRDSLNFRPALSYSLRRRSKDPERALSLFLSLTRATVRIDDPHIWHVVAEEFDRTFGHDEMASVIDRIIGAGRGPDPAPAFSPATRLQEYYTQSHSVREPRHTLWNLDDDFEMSATREARRKRGILVEA